NSDGDRDRPERRPENADEEDDEDKRRIGKHHVDEAAHEHVPLAGEVAAAYTEPDAQQRAHRNRGESDTQAVATTDDDAAKHVAQHIVCTERMGPSRRLEALEVDYECR